LNILLAAKSDEAYLVSHAVFRVANQAPSFNHVLFKDDFTTMSIVMYFRKNFYLQPAIDVIVSNFQSGGLIEHWHKNSVYRLQRNMKIRSNEPKKMTLDHLLGCFEVWAFGLIASSVCFLIEKLLSIAMSVGKVWGSLKNPEEYEE
jgi:hypothetical protein